jgi:hypothetical protein
MKVYLANQEGTNLYKIGVTKKEPTVRLKELQTGNASLLQLVESYPTKFGFKLESAMHAHYRLKQVNSEWFELTADDVDCFLIVCDKMEKTFEILKESNNPFF